ncbi:hypothetical protein EDD11_009132 [Mortierella claussenii]|nr:hypothetical protein EDD11_009132 [Mortierella claussenii]
MYRGVGRSLCEIFTMIAIGGHARSSLKIWDVRAKKFKFNATGLKIFTSAMAWSPCRKWLAIGSHDCAVRLWKIQDGEDPDALEVTYAALLQKFQSVTSLAWNPNPDFPMQFVTGSSDNSICVWRIVEDGRNNVRICLVWGSFPDQLNVTGTKITKVLDLGEKQRLLQQHGAIDDSAPSVNNSDNGGNLEPRSPLFLIEILPLA